MHAFNLALSRFDCLGHHRCLDGHIVGHVGLLHHGADLVHARTAEQAHKIVFERQVELRGARVALTTGTTAQLVVDASAFVTLGADDAQAAGLQDALLLGFARCARDVERLLALALRRRRQAAFIGGLHAGLEVGVEAALEQHVVSEHVGVAAEQDVGTAACHVRGDGDGADTAGLGDDVSLALMVFRVERLMLDAALVKQAGELLGALDRHRADKAGLTSLMANGHIVRDGVELRIDGAVDQIVLVDTFDLLVRRDSHNRQLVDLTELGVLGHSRTRHAGELVVEAEVVLQRDSGKRLVLLAHLHVLFGLERLMQALGVATAFHDATRELVDDLHLAVNDHVIDVAMEQELRLERLLQVVGQLAGGVGVDVVDAEHGLDFGEAGLGGVDGLLRLVHLEVLIELQGGHDACELVVRIGGARAGAGDDQRRAGLVDEDGVDLVDDGEMMAALHAGVGARDHVVAQVVEAEFGVGAVGDIGLVGELLGLGAHAVLDKTHAHAQKLIHLPHPLAVAARQVVVDGDDVHVLPAKGVEIAGKRGHERLALARAHLGDLAVVERHAADELHIEVTHAQRSNRRLAHRRERLGQHVCRGGACLHATAQLVGERAQLLV